MEYETPRIFGNPPPPRRTVRAYLHFDDSTSGKKFLNECIVRMVYFEKCSWGGWIDSRAVKITCCSCRGPGFVAQHPHASS